MKKIVSKFVGGMVAVVMVLVSYHSAQAASLESLARQTSTAYYVSPAGIDTNPCSLAAPCKSFNKAMSLVKAGDKIIALAGTYNQQVVVSKSDITLEGQGAIIDTTTQNGFKVPATVQNVTIRGFTVTRTWSHSIIVEGKFVTIENNTVYNSILENGTLSNGVITCGNGGWGSGIKASKDSSNVVIRNNTVYKTCGEGIAATMSTNVVIQNNTVSDNKSVNIYIDNSSYVQVLNNHSFCTKPSGNPMGIALGEESYSGWGAQLHDIVISGNTVTNCNDGIMAFNSDIGGTLTNVEISNNYIPSGQSKGVSLDNNKNSNVLIMNNTYYNEPWIRSRTGVTVTGNIVGTTSPTQASGTATFTPTATAPKPTNTATPVPVSATVTPVVILPSQTASSTPKPVIPTITPSVQPVSTQTPIPPTAIVIFTQTPLPPTAAPSNTPLPTFTQTLLPPTTAPSNTPLPTFTSEPEVSEPPPATIAPSEIVFDNTDGAFVYSSGWVDVEKRKAYGGSFKETSEKGASVTFAFTGQSFSILYTGGPAFRSMDVYVDDVLVGTINQKSAPRTFQARWDYTGQLEPGQHTLKLVYATKRGANTKGSLDAVIVR